MSFSGFSFFFLLTLAFAADIPHQTRVQQACILNETNHEVCTAVKPGVQVLERVKSKWQKRWGSPCTKHDEYCWARLALKYTNEVRHKEDVSPLVLGSYAQFENAQSYAKELSKKGKLVHQNLIEATKSVKCNRWIGGENLAYNYATGDVARVCVTQWIESPGHYDNLKRFWFKEMALGIWFDDDGRVYCVQTFGLVYPKGKGTGEGKKCQNVGKD